jgi:hypothetical protein
MSRVSEVRTRTDTPGRKVRLEAGAESEYEILTVKRVRRDVMQAVRQLALDRGATIELTVNEVMQAGVQALATS